MLEVIAFNALASISWLVEDFFKLVKEIKNSWLHDLLA